MKRNDRSIACGWVLWGRLRNTSSTAACVVTAAVPNVARLALLVSVLAIIGISVANAGPRSLLEGRHERVVIQQWDLSCGAAALATILKYQYNEPVTEREIAIAIMKRKEYLENPALVRARQGYSLLDLQRVLEGRNYKGVGLGNLSLQDLVERAPMIVPVKFLGYNHFVVFRGISHGQVVLADPAWGNRTMSAGAFMRAWHDHPKIGRTGLSVMLKDGSRPANRLAPTAKDVVLAYMPSELDAELTNRVAQTKTAPPTGASAVANKRRD